VNNKTVALPRMLVIALVAGFFLSLAINFVAVGWVAGQRIAAPERMERGMLRQMGRALPADIRAPLRAAVAERRGALFEAFRGMRGSRQAVRQALAQSDFDRAELEAALARQRQQMAALQQLMHAAMVDTAESLSDEQRARWSEAPLWMPGRPPPALMEPRSPRPTP